IHFVREARIDEQGELAKRESVGLPLDVAGPEVHVTKPTNLHQRRPDQATAVPRMIHSRSGLTLFFSHFLFSLDGLVSDCLWSRSRSCFFVKPRFQLFGACFKLSDLLA